MNIALDMMGGDYAPLQAVKGVAEYLATNPTDIHLTLIGNQPQIEECILTNPLPTGTYTIVHAQQVIEMNEHTTNLPNPTPELPTTTTNFASFTEPKRTPPTFVTHQNTIRHHPRTHPGDTFGPKILCFFGQKSANLMLFLYIFIFRNGLLVYFL